MIGFLIGFEFFYKKFDLLFEIVFYMFVFDYFCRDDLFMLEVEFVMYCVVELEVLIECEGVDIIVVFIGEFVLGIGGIVLLFEGYW